MFSLCTGCRPHGWKPHKEPRRHNRSKWWICSRKGRMGRICCCSIVCTWYWHGSWCHLWRCHATAIPGLVLGSSNGWWVYKGCTLNYLKSYWNGAHPRHSVMVLVLHTLNLLWSRNTKSNLAELFVWSDGRGAYWWQRWWQLKVIKCNHLPASSAMTSFRSFSVSSSSFGLLDWFLVT